MDFDRRFELKLSKKACKRHAHYMIYNAEVTVAN